MVLTAKFGNLFHHMALLIDLDRKDTAVLALIVHLADSVGKTFVEIGDPLVEQILNPQQNRHGMATLFQTGDNIEQGNLVRAPIVRSNNRYFTLF